MTVFLLIIFAGVPGGTSAAAVKIKTSDRTAAESTFGSSWSALTDQDSVDPCRLQTVDTGSDT